MAERSADPEDLTCPVCLEPFKEPLTLGCKHRVCRSCLLKHWDQAKAKACPVCKRKSSKEVIFVNFSKTPVCGAHPEGPSLFCLDEARPVCPVCEFSQHKEHTVVPLEQVETCLKQQLHTELQPLLKLRAEAQSLKQLYKNLLQHSEKQAAACEAHIQAEFSRFRRFLQEEEELRLKAVREEQSRQAQTVSPELGRIRDTLTSVERSIQELQTQLQSTQEDFISSYRPAQTHSPEPLPQPRPDLHFNQAKLRGNLAFRVWKKMGSIVQFSPVVLDPNTADPRLGLSEDLTSVRYLDPNVDLPEAAAPVVLPEAAAPVDLPEAVAPVDLPEALPPVDLSLPLVLGSKGVRSGTCHWDVEVGDHQHWAVGFAEQSVDRKPRSLTPEAGFWFLAFENDEYRTFNKTLEQKRRLKKICVQLNYARGTVSFYDPSDMSLIHTLSHKFTETLVPFVSLGRTDADCTTQQLHVRPRPGQVLPNE